MQHRQSSESHTHLLRAERWLKEVEPELTSVQVEAHQESPFLHSTVIRAKIGRKWLVVKKRAESIGEAVKMASETLIRQARKLKQQRVKSRRKNMSYKYNDEFLAV
ncbi:MAG: hypothetical protein COW00_16615 [Bdellovibrio sp. CG12_big_fil_rev_8_21_14_0_65_39_13]|nr:MAG: hypothetical protein COW78_09905 [Bdellovibrio sp. CG22_combo_CG10-13_8_21_14_all_39_27]PIQ58231.1 MAG: hypothetical protein COW00_16615 [Bdellovibrio sp. CG12_big_fil_rev_8_21_14_0_65_39_13]PIR36640.1 MAG: hypothetical protein COV37_02135 [Bdellovibrio sp. CG11_big_fil_rev_8_21_14_0_20_39_38]